jgi:hypothetical protein
MRQNTALAMILGLLCATGSVGAKCRPTNGYSDILAAFARTGLDPDASGSARSMLSAIVAQLQIDVAGLAPSTTYQLAADDTIAASFRTDDKGGARVLLRAGDDSSPLDFDPRGREIEVRHGADDVLRLAMVAGASGAPGTKRVESVALKPTALAPGGKARAVFRSTADGRQRLQIEVEHAPPGSYAVFVAGIERGSLAAPAGIGELEFGDDGVGSPPLDFDPQAAQIDLVLNDAILFSGVLTATVPDMNSCEPSELRRRLTPEQGGESSARMRTRADCDRDFEVEIEDVDAGAYQLRVGGVVRGTILAAFDPARGRVRGEIEFDTDDDEATELPLDFDPLGQPIEIFAGADLAFSIGALAPGAGTADSCTPEDDARPLAANAVQPSASGRARLRVRDDCRTRLNVEIEDVVAGDYAVIIGGVSRATMTAAFDAVKGQVRGEVEFGDDDAGSPPLDFDPHGQTVEIEQLDVTVLSGSFGLTPGGSGPNCVDDRSSVALLNQGVDADAHAEARLRVRDDCRQTFTVVIEDVPAGSYQVLVDASVRATIVVGATGRGEVELDTNDPPKPVLNFDPHGREIGIAKSGALFFVRVFPN